MFNTLARPGKVERSPSRLFDMGVAIVDLSSNREKRRDNNVKRDSIPTGLSLTGYEPTKFVATKWERQLGDTSYMFSMVDKRVIGAGVLLTALAFFPYSPMADVQAFVVNCRSPHNGLRRIVNDSFPFDAATFLVRGLESSVVSVDVNGKPSLVQAADYLRAISTISTVESAGTPPLESAKV